MEKDLDEVTQRVEVLVVPAFRFSHDTGWNDCFDASAFELVDDSVGVVSAVSKASATRDMIDEFFGYGTLVLLSRSDKNVNRFACTVNDRVELAGYASAGSSYSVFFGPPLPPEESWCARTTDASNIPPTSSSERESSLKIFNHRSVFDQFRKRL